MATTLEQILGKPTFLRVNEIGSGFGPPIDFIDVEAVVILDVRPDEAYGLKLRADQNQTVRQGMLDLLRDAFENDTTVLIDFLIDREFGRKHGFVYRVALLKGEPPSIVTDFTTSGRNPEGVP